MAVSLILFVSILYLSRVMTQNTRVGIFRHVGNINAESLSGNPVFSRIECVMLCTSAVRCVTSLYCEDSTIQKTCQLHNEDESSFSDSFKQNGSCEVYMRINPNKYGTTNEATNPNGVDTTTEAEGVTTAEEITTEATTTLEEATTETTITVEEATTTVEEATTEATTTVEEATTETTITVEEATTSVEVATTEATTTAEEVTTEATEAATTIEETTMEAITTTVPPTTTTEVTTIAMTCQNGGTPGSPCNCLAGTTGTYCETRIQDCKDVADYVSTSPDTYTIWPTNSATSFDIECTDFNNYGIQMMFRHTSIAGCTITSTPVTYLDASWTNYKNGFIDSNCYMWLGLEKIYAITTLKPYKLVMNILNSYGEATVATYSSFSIGDEGSEYRLSVSGFSAQGNIGDYFNLEDPTNTIDGGNFCTKDHCVTTDVVCGEWAMGGWWHRQDKCQINPHNQWGIQWEIADGSPGGMKDMVMWLVSV